MTESDATLAARAAAGTEEAFAALVGRYQRSVFNLIVRMVRDPASAEELAQDVFLKAFRRLHTFDSRYRFSSWLLKIAHNTAIDHLRRRRPDTESLDEGVRPSEAHHVAGPWPAPPPDPEREATRGELAEALESALARLRPDYRRVVVLRYQEELSHEEIADITGLPVGTIKSHLHRARAEMAAYLSRTQWAPPATAGEGLPTATRKPGGS